MWTPEEAHQDPQIGRVESYEPGQEINTYGFPTDSHYMTDADLERLRRGGAIAMGSDGQTHIVVLREPPK